MRLRGILLRKRFLFAQLWVKLSQGAGRLPWVSLPATLHIVSRQPKEGKDDSNSVKNQRDLLNEYYERHSDEFESEDEYVDDGHTGTDANRENFQRLLADVMSGKINCVIVKDLSRFARNYSDAGSLIENLFVQMNVRFISLAENVDSYKDPDSVSNIIVPITNVMNDNYCFQTSKKIRQVFDYKRRNGQYIGSFAPYGYVKHPKDKHQLIVDPDAAETVKLVLAQDGPQAAGKGQADLRLDSHLADTGNLVLHRIFHCNDIPSLPVQGHEGRIKRGGFSAAGGPRYEEQPMGLPDDLLQLLQIHRGKAQPCQVCPGHIPVQQPQYEGFPMDRRQGRNPDIHGLLLPGPLEPAILRQALFPDIHAGGNLEAGQQGLLQIFRYSKQVLQDSVDPAADHQIFFFRFQVDVASPQRESLLQDRFGQMDRRSLYFFLRFRRRRLLFF